MGRAYTITVTITTPSGFILTCSDFVNEDNEDVPGYIRAALMKRAEEIPRAIRQGPEPIDIGTSGGTRDADEAGGDR